MGILDELSSSTGDKTSNHEMVERCLKIPALLHTLAEGMRTGAPKARIDCAEVLTEMTKRQPDLLGDFVTDFLDASRSDNKTIAKLAFTALTYITPIRPAEIYSQREYFLDLAKSGEPLSLDASAVLGALCGNNPNYRGKLLGNVLRLLSSVPDKDLPKWINNISPAIKGSIDSFKRLMSFLQPRLANLEPPIAKKVNSILLKLERSTAKK